MKCIYCGSDMQLGGKIIFEGGIAIGKKDYLWGQTMLTDAYYCQKCKKIIGVFSI